LRTPPSAQTMLATSMLSLSANRAEVSTGNLRGDAGKFDNLKASWEKGLEIGDFKTKVAAKYDYNSNKDFLKEVSFSGDLVEGDSADDVSVSYELRRDFASKRSDVRLTASSQGTTLSAEYDTEDQLTEVAVQREVDLGDQKVDVQPSWMVKAKAARVKLMSGLNNGKDKVSAQFDYDVDGKEVGALEVGFTRQLKAGQTLAASYKPDKSDLEVSLQDDNFEDGATWTATANVPLESADANLLDAARVTLKRSWGW